MSKPTPKHPRKTPTPEVARQIADRRRSNAAGIHRNFRTGYDRRGVRQAAIREQVA